LESREEFVNGRPHGIFQKWYENGRPRNLEVFRNGIVSRRKLWYSNGQILAVVVVFRKAGRIEGEYRHWSRDGSTIEEDFYLNGMCIDSHFTVRKRRIFQYMINNLKFRLLYNKYFRDLTTFIISDLAFMVLK